MTDHQAAPEPPDTSPAVPTGQTDHLTIPEAAGVLGVSERTIRRAIERGQLQVVKSGRSVQIPVTALASVQQQPDVPVHERPQLRLVEPALDDERDVDAGHTPMFVDLPLIRMPTPLTGFIGRVRDVEAVTALLRRDDVRLLTLLGVGGVGKTRLAIRAAQEAAASFADGAVFVPLASIHDPGLLPSTIVQTLGLPLVVSQTPLSQLQTALRTKQMLVVLDNFEHLVPAGPAVTELLSDCEGVTVLVTSRVRLRLSGERTYHVQPLAVPARSRAHPSDRSAVPVDLSQIESVQLFVERAQAARAGFTLSREHTPAIAAICTRLDGLPLAIELAAARCTVLTPASMLARLDQRLPLLTGGPRDQPDRLRTMRDAIAWSYDLLTPVEQALFRRLSVFAGGFTLEAAGAMLRQPPDTFPAEMSELAFATVESLVGQSLLVEMNPADPSPAHASADELRFTMLETIREFGQEKLAASGEERAVRALHAAYFLELVEAAGASLAHGPTTRLDRVDAERDNLRAALAWVIDQQDTDPALRLAAALGPVWLARGPYREGRTWLERALSLGDGPHQPRLVAMNSLARLLFHQGEFARSASVGEAALALARSHGDQLSIAQGLIAFGQAVDRAGDLSSAVACFEEALALFREIGDATGEADALNHLSTAAWEQGNVPRFATLASEALAIWRRLDELVGVIQSLDRLSLAARVEGRLADQAKLASEIVALTQKIEDPNIIASTLWTAAAITGERGQAALSARFFGAEEALRETTGFVLDPAFVESYTTMVGEVRATLGEARFASIWASGRTLEPARALAEAKAALELLAGASSSTDKLTAAAAYGLTPREREVLRLVVSGHSDKEIAATLFVSRSTASKHVSAILEKLGAESRTAATALAYREGLL